ncbi:MAG: hypothetical protein SGI90_14535 [Candidatus Eisenbacteria bacterium]|nr:hypothetical protein [Candidatus Eisenbacteria bacterium]
MLDGQRGDVGIEDPVTTGITATNHGEEMSVVGWTITKHDQGW